MPGILYHLTFAKNAYENMHFEDVESKINFFAGNLIPDLVEDKMKSHYRTNASISGLFVPNMNDVKAELFDLSSPIKLGMYSHLYLDYYFIEHFLIPSFIWDSEKKMVISRRNNKVWPYSEFFSPSGLYGSYSEINQLLLKNKDITTDEIQQIPEILPSTGIKLFDKRIERTWKEELSTYLSHKKDYTGDVFDYFELTSFIKKTAQTFAVEITK